jgi:AcrR family transcriptional regulator
LRDDPRAEVLVPPRRNSVAATASRTALLDAAEQVMLEEGYAAASSRRVAARAGLDPAVVYYYFGTMDDLFIELFRRNADRSQQRLEEALGSPQPLWSLWEVSHNQIDTSLLLEFNALANHRKAIQAEISAYSERFRRFQIDVISRAVHKSTIGPMNFAPEALVVLVTGMARYLQLEEAFGNRLGHGEVVGLIEDLLGRIEGSRRSSP